MNHKSTKILCLTLMLVFLTSCGNRNSKVDQIMQSQMEANNNNDNDSNEVKEEGIDIDLTALSSTMVFSEVYNMMSVPDDYIGKMIKMNGSFTVFEDEETGQLYFACIISDATACCTQGIEFELEGKYTFPDDYPKEGSNITVTGEFETYDEDGSIYCRLKNARLN